MRNKEKRKLTTAILKTKKMSWLNKYRNQPCEICNKTFPVACMDLHHKNPLIKRDGIGRLIRDAYSFKVVKEEAKKCMCICSNCHRIIHSKERVYDKETYKE